ncbi:hypothetical protein GGI22_002870 [Coemansia erecta]|nr:hypothetical protein GGI22_002870 [Coemansia erecta]
MDVANTAGAGHNDYMADSSSSEESNALADVMAAFLYYKTYALNSSIYRRLHSIDELSERHRGIVASLGTIDKIKSAEGLIRENYKFLLDLVHSSAVGAMPSPRDSPDEFSTWYKQFICVREGADKPIVADHHMEKLYSTLKQFVRDWSVEGQEERDLTYGPLLDALESEFSDVAPESRGSIQVLVPGAGLGRLAFEVCCRGFSSQGNEFSYFMLLASNFILNKTESPDQYTVYPFVHQFSNVVSAKDQLRPVTIPDVLPSSMPYASTAEFSMTAGDFVEVYSSGRELGKWDAIVTCFFMDTAKNVLDYLDTMWHAMKPGAVWINLGPLLWHFDNVDGEQSIELTRDEFVELVAKVGFELDPGLFKAKVPVSYTANSKSMLQYTYSTFMCVARKPNDKE